MAACKAGLWRHSQAGLESQVIAQWDEGQPKGSTGQDPNPVIIPLMIGAGRGQIFRQDSSSTPVRTLQGQLSNPKRLALQPSPTSWPWLLVTVQGQETASSQSTYVCPAGPLAAAIPIPIALGSVGSLTVEPRYRPQVPAIIPSHWPAFQACLGLSELSAGRVQAYLPHSPHTHYNNVLYVCGA